jgi:hypothetical protein
MPLVKDASPSANIRQGSASRDPKSTNKGTEAKAHFRFNQNALALRMRQGEKLTKGAGRGDLWMTSRRGQEPRLRDAAVR